ncbi:hypothetical protein PHISP_08038 [Aspergillus sp. HF37]|nr:hypothetical protein PHISP_08038 [Aspergillus sp. HF37]
MPSVRSLSTRVDACATLPSRRGRSPSDDTQGLDLHELFSAFPNLEDLSVSINRLRGGCIVGRFPSDTEISTLKLSDDEVFPPIRALSLSGYWVYSEEQVWAEKFPWKQLRSLSLGPQDNLRFLEQATGRVQSLTEFEITSPKVRVKASEAIELDNFVSSFHTLETLTAKGMVPPLDAVAHHPNLRRLCLHVIENTKVKRQNLDAKQIGDLDQHCPGLISLEIDLDPDGSGTWPYESIESIAKGFKNLRQLSIHVALGIAQIRDLPDEKEDLASALTKTTAEDFERRFFKHRRSSSVLEVITLKTGESLRWFPHWRPKYARVERKCAKTVKIYPPVRSGDEPLVDEGESYSTR